MFQKIAAHDLTFLQYCALITMCVFSNCMLSDLQALGDLLMHTSGNNEHQEHGLEY